MGNLIDHINKEIEEMKNINAIAPEEVLEKLPTMCEEQETKTMDPPMKKRGRPPKVQNEIFVEMWTAALDKGSLSEVAASLGTSPASCSVKASNLRKAGYDLPQFKRGRPKKVQ